MKQGIHPEYHEINVVMTDGTTFTTRSTYGKEGDTLRLDIDTKSHPAWTGVQRINVEGGQVAKFGKKFGAFGVPQSILTAAKTAQINKPAKVVEKVDPKAQGAKKKK